jgi:hypothetical protein
MEEKMSKKTCLVLVVIFIGFFFSNGFSYAKPNTGIALDSNPQLKKVKEIFKRSCITCHGGPVPAQELSLEPGNLLSNTINVSSMEKTDLKIIDTSNPRNSYLIMKIKNEKNIVGKRMPLKSEPLREEEIKTIEEWILSLQGTPGLESGQKPIPAARPGKNVFWGTRLINLTTPTVIPGGDFLFRISHRFVRSVKKGYDAFYGIDGPAIIFLSLGYGISRNLDITIGRSNLFQELEFMLKWRILSTSRASSFPLSIALHTGGNWVTQSNGSVSDSDIKYNLQLCAAYSLSPKISLLLVPGYSSNVNHFQASSEGTFALGTGISIKLTRNLAIMGEWIPVLSGYNANFNGWGLGFQYRIGKHLFQVFALNTSGITTDQFMAGGDLRLKDGDFRFGFNIFREF